MAGGGAIARRKRRFGDENFYGPLGDKIQEAGWLGLGASLGLTKKLNICNRPLEGEEETRL